MTHRQFTEANPSEKSTVVVGGLNYVAWRIHKLTAEMKVLNRWINQVPNLVENGEEIAFNESLQEANDLFFDKADKFLDQIMICQNELNRLNDFYTKKLNS